MWPVQALRAFPACLFLLVACLLLSRSPAFAVLERQLAADDLTIFGPALPSEAELLAARRFTSEVKRLSGLELRLAWGSEPPAGPCLLIGNRQALATQLEKLPLGAIPASEDTANQSYVLATLAPWGSANHQVALAAGLGEGSSPRAFLGLSYALGDLLRRLDLRDGRWTFALPRAPQIQSPAMPNRTLYIMNSYNCNPGLSLDHFSPTQIDDYVDRLVEARYSRVSLWQWSEFYLYPDNEEAQRARHQQVHQTMRSFFERARARGLEVYQQITPSHIKPYLLPAEARFTATGHYAPWALCWSQPEVRALAWQVMRLEMEYYGPVDGYSVWFYDPGGCFCAECAAHQAERLFDQLMLIVDLAKDISPLARFEASLWPTWIFPYSGTSIGYPGKGYTQEDVNKLVADFLALAHTQFGPGGLTIMDGCEADNTTIYNGQVDQKNFQREGFLYTTLGIAGETAYPFVPFRLEYTTQQLGKARDRGLEGAMLFLQYSATNFPGVFVAADCLYEGGDWEEAMTRYALTEAKGEALPRYLELLKAVEELNVAPDRPALERAVTRIERAWDQLEPSPDFAGDREWLEGFTIAQRAYLHLAKAETSEAFDLALSEFRAALAELPMYQDFATQALSEVLVREHHLPVYWKGAENQPARAGPPG